MSGTGMGAGVTGSERMKARRTPKQYLVGLLVAVVVSALLVELGVRLADTTQLSDCNGFL